MTELGFKNGKVQITFVGLTEEAVDHEIHFIQHVIVLMAVFIAVASMTAGI